MRIGVLICTAGWATSAAAGSAPPPPSMRVLENPAGGVVVEWVNLDEVAVLSVDCRAIYLFFHGEGVSPSPSIREIEWKIEDNPPE